MLLLSFGLVILLLLSSCSSPNTGVGPTLGFDLSPDDTEKPDLKCPDEKTLYNLWLSHDEVLDVEDGGEKFHLEWTNIPPSFFQLWINPSGTISTENIVNNTDIGYHGTMIDPDNDDCPVATFDGVWELHAEIIGSCKNDIVYVHIEEEWINPVLQSDCGSSRLEPGFYSAPELDLVFDLSEEYPSDGFTIPEGGLYHASYNYHLYPVGFDLPPLVPDK
jgi:hypothetical protein